MTMNNRPRQLVICCDGTNNTLTGGVEDTNVLRLYEHLRRHTPTDTAPYERLLYYDPGVGNPDTVPPTGLIDWVSRSWQRMSGLASGRGIYDNIEQAYAFLMRNWRDEQDQIYLFGFSRGAFTVRAVAGMVHLFGILKPQHEQLLPTLVHIYFSLPAEAHKPMQQFTRWLHRAVGKRGKAAAEVGAHPKEAPVSPREALAAQVRNEFTSKAGSEAWVHWVGVWDTVASVGLPGPMSRMNPSTATLQNKRIRNVRHALSFDEHRWTFEPRLYEVPADIDGPDRTLKQRWYPGVHCDVGGSYPRDECGFSDAALAWMTSEVSSALDVPPIPASKARYVRHDALWDTPWWALAGMTMRDMRPRVPAPDSAGEKVTMKVIPAELPPGEVRSVWRERRPLWPLFVAAVLGGLCLELSGWCLLPDFHVEDGLAEGMRQSIAAACAFADDQLASLWFKGLLDETREPWMQPGQPGWAMFWDLGFILGWGYLLARISSRSFAWIAGARSPKSRMPLWCWLGMAPLLAVGGDVTEDLLTWFALVAHGIGTDMVAHALLFLTGMASLAKLAGLVACVPLVVVRFWMIFRPNSEKRPALDEQKIC